jgi:hypothetical protein
MAGQKSSQDSPCLQACEADDIVIRAIIDGFKDVGISQPSVFVAVISNPIDGFYVSYKKSSCKCCDNFFHAEIFANAISALLKILSAIDPSSTTVTPEQQAYSALDALLNSYINYKKRCQLSEKCQRRIQLIYNQAFSDANKNLVLDVPPVTLTEIITEGGGQEISITSNKPGGAILINAIYITALTSYTSILLEKQCAPVIVSKNTVKTGVDLSMLLTELRAIATHGESCCSRVA